MKKLKTLIKILTLTLFCFLLSSPAALAANIVIDKETGQAGPGLFHTPNYANDAACIQAALDSSKSGDTITICAGDYYITKGIYQKNKNLNIIGEGNVTLYIQTPEKEYNELYFCGSLITSGKLSADANKDSFQVVLTDASQVRQNDLIKIWKNVQWCPLDYPDNYPDQMTGEIYAVKSVNGNIVTLNQPLLRDYSLSETVQFEVYRPVEIHVNNIRMEDTGAAMSHHGLVMQYCKDSSVTNSWFNNSGFGAVCLYSCFNVNVNNNEIYNSLLPGSGYGVNVASGTAFVNIENNHIENCRHAITANSAERKSLNRDVFISNNTLIGAKIRGSWVIDAHALTINFVVTGNKIYPQLPYFVAFSDGTQQSIFSDNEVFGGYGGIFKRGAVSDGVHICENNTFNGIAGEMYRGGNGIDDTLIIRNNYQNSGIYGIHFPYQGSFRNIVITGNTFSNLLNKGVYQQFLIDGVNLKISDNTFENIREEGIYLDGNSYTNSEVKIQNNNLINVYSSSPGSEITIKNIQDASVSGNQIFDAQVSKVPVAAFSASPISGNAPLDVTFTDSSTGSPTAWNWNFGDGTSSTEKSPTHTYSTAGNYTVILTASNAAGSNTVTGIVHVKPPEDSEEPVISEIEVSDNRLREKSPDVVYQSSPYIDVGGMNSVRYRDIMWFDLSKYTSDFPVDNATLSLYWYYPAENSRPEDTVIEVYRPASAWNSDYVSWNKKDKDVSWKNPGGDWYDKNGVSQGNTPYATITLKGSTLPDNNYYELDVTELVKEYINGKYENTGFLIKARTESNNYIAFYSSDCGNEDQEPKLSITKKASSVTVPVVTVNATVTSATDNRLREKSPDVVYKVSPFIDAGGMNSVRYRDIMWLNLSEYTGSAEVSNAALSLYWYYPAGKTRPEDTVIEVYRPASAWNSDYVSWNKKDKDVSWKNPGGDWYDKNGVLQGNSPYAILTFKGSDIPDNKYYELNVTDLVKEYTSGKYENTGFLIKARTESNNYIAFYSSDCGNENQVPKLQLVYS
ncbi:MULTISPECIES: disaggregatase related repeat-containing protein [unclassified Methanosarcina]|uniref:disaggregatase related repeat-containing protein n=1 Tax=unclassified Methanosarcina TaxID=2644672 RepID=UPI00061546C8|nr:MULTISPECIES: disaggregatase related repeat-containing protein [unclassified Methanosarcina]AKB20051.1 hypothetical protein MSWHS_3188 [Methanosarcina sp. WWM596]AKB21623.1 hypothetical protein MSWH1_1352 [Methanosarcina sp. WH1]